MFHVEHSTKIKKMNNRSHALLICTQSRTVTRLYITPSCQADVMKAQIGSDFITWRKIKIGSNAYEMYCAAQKYATGDTGFRVNCDTFIGNALLFPLKKADGTIQDIVENWKLAIVSIEKNIFFLKKEWVWFPDDMESELDWEWVIKPSKKEMARRA
jgi:hypothetical protein